MHKDVFMNHFITITKPSKKLQSLKIASKFYTESLCMRKLSVYTCVN